MSKQFTVRGLEKLDSLNKKLTDPTVQNACARALNSSAKKAVTAIPRLFKERYNIKTKASDMKKMFYIERAEAIDRLNMTATISIRRNFSRKYFSMLSDFGAKEKMAGSGKKRRKVVSVKILKGGSAGIVSDGGRGAFIMQAKGGRFVAVRKGKARLPVKKLGVSFESMFGMRQDATGEKWQELMQDTLQKELDKAFKLD